MSTWIVDVLFHQYHTILYFTFQGITNAPVLRVETNGVKVLSCPRAEKIEVQYPDDTVRITASLEDIETYKFVVPSEAAVSGHFILGIVT